MPGHSRPLADDERVLEGGDDPRLRQRQRIAGALQLPELDAVAGVERLHGAVDAEDEDAPAGDERRGRDANADAFFHFTWPPSSATTSPPAVTTAATLPSLPTPAEIWAPTLVRQSERPVSASTAVTVPSVAAIVSTLPLTATVSGNLTAPICWFQTGLTVIGATIGWSSLGLGLSSPKSRAAGEQRGGGEAGQRRDERPAIASRRLRRKHHLAGSAPLAAGWTPRRLSLASTRRR
jgi:hypothetical protein